MDQYRDLFRVIARIFYEDLEIVVMDYIVKVYFEKQFFLTSEATTINIPEKNFRQVLHEFKKASLIQTIQDDKLNNPDYANIKKKIEEMKPYDQNPNYIKIEIWELNRKIKDLIEDKLKVIESKMEAEYKDYDPLAKICTSKFCMHNNEPLKTQDYHFEGGKCPKCKSDLMDLYQQEHNMISDSRESERGKMFDIIRVLRDRLADITVNEIPDLYAIKEQSQPENTAGRDDLERNREENNVDTRYVKFEPNFFDNSLKPDNNFGIENAGFNNFEGLGEDLISHMVGYDFQKTIANYKKKSQKPESNDFLKKRDSLKKYNNDEYQKQYEDWRNSKIMITESKY